MKFLTNKINAILNFICMAYPIDAAYFVQTGIKLAAIKVQWIKDGVCEGVNTVRIKRGGRVCMCLINYESFASRYLITREVHKYLGSRCGLCTD